MKKQIFICMLIILASYASMTDKYPTFKKMRSIITIMSQVQSKMSTSSPLKDIMDLLLNYLSQIEEEQLNHNVLLQKSSQECEDEGSYRVRQIEDGSTAQTQAQTILEHCEKQNLRASSEQESTSKQLTETRVYL